YLQTGARPEPAPRAFVVDRLVPAGVTTLFYGHGGIGKSYVLIDLAAHVALGRPWLGLTTQERPVLYVDPHLDPADYLRPPPRHPRRPRPGPPPAAPPPLLPPPRRPHPPPPHPPARPRHQAGLRRRRCRPRQPLHRRPRRRRRARRRGHRHPQGPGVLGHP